MPARLHTLPSNRGSSMQRSTLAAVAALMVLGLPAAQAQTAGTWMVKAGLNRIAPQVTSGNLSAPGLPGTKIDVQEADSLIVTGTYMITSHWSAEFFAGLPYEHDVTGDGAIRGVGRIGTVKQISPTVIAQYRFGEPAARFRPYVGLGLTYPGGRPTQMSVDSAFGLSPQIGASFWLTPKWFLDVSVIKTYLKTTSHLSSGQSIDTKLDPLSVGLSIGYRY